MGKKHSKSPKPMSSIDDDRSPATGFYDGDGRWSVFDESRRGFFDEFGQYFRFDETEPDRYFWDDRDICYEFENNPNENRKTTIRREYADVTDDPEFWTDWDDGGTMASTKADDDGYATIDVSKMDQQRSGPIKIPPPPRFPPPAPPPQKTDGGYDQYEEVAPPLPPKDYPKAAASTQKSPPIPPRPTPPIPKRPIEKKGDWRIKRHQEEEFPAHLAARFEVWFRKRLVEQEERRRRNLGKMSAESSPTSPKVAQPPPLEPVGDSVEEKKAIAPPVPSRPKRRPPSALIAALRDKLRAEEAEAEQQRNTTPAEMSSFGSAAMRKKTEAKDHPEESNYQIPDRSILKVSRRRPPPRPRLPPKPIRGQRREQQQQKQQQQDRVASFWKKFGKQPKKKEDKGDDEEKKQA